MTDKPVNQQKTLAQSLRDFRAFMYGEVVGIAIPTLFWFGAFITGVFLGVSLVLDPELRPLYCQASIQIEAVRPGQ